MNKNTENCSTCGKEKMICKCKTEARKQAEVPNLSYGWICPICKCGVSPHVDNCPCNLEKPL